MSEMILCENLVKIYKTKDVEVLALSGLDLSIEEGSLTAVVGSSGSGKSTFLNMLGALDRPSAGRLLVDGHDLFQMGDRELVEYKKHTVGFVWQNNARNLFPYLTALENVEVPLMLAKGEKKGRQSHKSRERALELLELTGMLQKKDRRLTGLSGGEQQRVAIAIALANQPKLLLADEPTGSVDKRTSRELLDVFFRLNRELKMTIVIVTHDNSLAAMLPRVIRIRDGRVSSESIRKSALMTEGGMERISQWQEEALEAQEELAVLDKHGRVQIPEELLKEAGIRENRVRLHACPGQIVLSEENREEERI